LRTSILFVTLLLAALTGCRSNHPYPERLYEEVLELESSHGGTGGLRTDVREKMERRWGSAVRWSEEGLLVTAQDYLWTSLVLSISDHIEQLDLALELAIRASELGEERGSLAFAIVTDKLAFARGERYQRYGTYIRFQPVLGKWELHPIDPRTTDAERAAMGVPPLVDIQAELTALNASQDTRDMQGRILSPGKRE
jgi:hypothetical protein